MPRLLVDLHLPLGGDFSKSLFFVYAAQFLRWGVLMIGRGKNHMDIPKL